MRVYGSGFRGWGFRVPGVRFLEILIFGFLGLRPSGCETCAAGISPPSFSGLEVWGLGFKVYRSWFRVYVLWNGVAMFMAWSYGMGLLFCYGSWFMIYEMGFMFEGPGLSQTRLQGSVRVQGIGRPAGSRAPQASPHARFRDERAVESRAAL